MTELKTDVIERLQEWADRATELFPQQQRVCVVDDALIADLRTAIAELTTSRATCARLHEEIANLRADRPSDQSIPADLQEMAKQSAVMLAELDAQRASFVNNLEAELYSCMAHAYQRGQAQVATVTAELDMANEAAVIWRTQLAERIVRDEALTAALRRAIDVIEELLRVSGDPNAVTGTYDTTAGRARRAINELNAVLRAASEEV